MSHLDTASPGRGRAETTIDLRIGELATAVAYCTESLLLYSLIDYTIVVPNAVEAKKLPPPHELRHSRECYIVVALDQEEIYRTATVDKSLK